MYLQKQQFVSLILCVAILFVALLTLSTNAQTKPQPPQIELTNIEATTATIQWNSLSGAVQYHIFVCDETDTCNRGIRHNPTSDATQTRIIDDLMPGKDYSITATVHNGVQWSDYSNWLFIKTKKSVTPVNPNPPPPINPPPVNPPPTPPPVNPPPPPPLPTCTWTDRNTTREQTSCSNSQTVSRQTQKQQVCGPNNCAGGDCTVHSLRWINTGNPTSTQCTNNRICSNGSCVAPTACTTDSDCLTSHVCNNGICVNSSTACAWRNTGATRQLKACIEGTRICASSQTVFAQPQAEQRCGPSNCMGMCSGDQARDSVKWVDTGDPMTSRCPWSQTCSNGECIGPPPECALLVYYQIIGTSRMKYFGPHTINVKFPAAKQYLTMFSYHRKDADDESISTTTSSFPMNPTNKSEVHYTINSEYIGAMKFSYTCNGKTYQTNLRKRQYF
ncbi:MAG: fibronectin type III domain-containing protein [Candidatus Spechtbacteria bacterium SB0662_bin_43]|uniref:Fibronectin type III domain-containing protein n=1 Tax=Candidatus Spechtbacteria bacterium SB0662_bin_43 TaxID=2604897 RepID=A0A845DAK5_9BACT|nr:fibronectin type III domain-containing protein [Candidatus Spechtbacteria bacterium SB0662_bin_43]